MAFFFAVANPGAVKTVPSVKNGFMLAMPEETVLALARAMVLKKGPQEGLLLEVKKVTMDDDAYRLRLRAWRVDQDNAHRDFDVAGPFERTKDARLKAVVRTVEKVKGQALPPDVLGMLTRSQLLEQIALVMACEEGGDAGARLGAGISHGGGNLLNIFWSQVRRELA